MDTLNEEIQRVDKEAVAQSKSKTPKPSGQVFLFSGYMVDHPGKEQKSFPADKEEHICKAIREGLKKYDAGPDDRAYLAGLSAGSEIIFAEVCAGLGMTVKSYLPLPESAYIREFVAPGGDAWVERFYKVRNHPLVDENYQSERLGPPKEGDDLYERNNRWALYSSLVRGVDKVRLIALWDGKGGRPKDRDARLVKHMIELMRETGGTVEQINSAKYIHSFVDGTFEGLPDLSKPVIPVVAKSVKKKRDSISESRRKKM